MRIQLTACMSRRLIQLILISLMLYGCGGGDSGSTGAQKGPPVQGARVLGMDVKENAMDTYGDAYSQAMSLGVREVSISLDWALLEPTPGNYDNTLPGIIDSFYPSQAGDVTLVLRPLDTPGPSVPAGLEGLSYDNPQVISAFNNFLANLHAQLSTLNASGKLKWIHIGNEIDAYLGTNVTRWNQWQTFFKAAKDRVESLWGSDVIVSSIIQFSVLNDTSRLSLYSNLLTDLDSAVLTYYPLNSDFTMRGVSTVDTDFKTMVNKITGKNIILQECGYPSSPINGSSEATQADFISAVFDAWDRNINRISLIDIAWQNDVSSATVDQWVIDYGMSGNAYESAFKAYLATLGLKNYNGTEKLAMQRLRDELKARKWLQ